MTTVQVQAVTKYDERQAIDVIVLPFSMDPVVRWLYPNPHQYLINFPELVKAFCGRAFEQGTAQYLEGFIGAALWLPPDVQPDEEPVGELLQRTIPEEDQGTVFSVLEQMGSFHPSEPHWYLPMIGVDPTHQSKGHGAALLQRTLSKCDSQKTLAYLDSTNPKNIPLYERHGFELLGTIQEEGTPPIYPMLRKPQ